MSSRGGGARIPFGTAAHASIRIGGSTMRSRGPRSSPRARSRGIAARGAAARPSARPTRLPPARRAPPNREHGDAGQPTRLPRERTFRAEGCHWSKMGDRACLQRQAILNAGEGKTPCCGFGELTGRGGTLVPARGARRGFVRAACAQARGAAAAPSDVGGSTGQLPSPVSIRSVRLWCARGPKARPRALT